jgi:hypothetical protein
VTNKVMKIKGQKEQKSNAWPEKGAGGVLGKTI